MDKQAAAVDAAFRRPEHVARPQRKVRVCRRHQIAERFLVQAGERKICQLARGGREHRRSAELLIELR